MITDHNQLPDTRRGRFGDGVIGNSELDILVHPSGDPSIVIVARLALDTARAGFPGFFVV